MFTLKVWTHACSHGFHGCGYGFKGFHGCIAMVFLLNNIWWWMLLEAIFFLQWGSPKVYLVSQFFVGMLSILFHVDFNCIFIFQIYHGLCGNGYILCSKFSYKWYHCYGFIIVTLDWIYRNAWEDKRKGKIYELFIVDLRVLGLLLWWDFGKFWACEIIGQNIFLDISFNWGF